MDEHKVVLILFAMAFSLITVCCSLGVLDNYLNPVYRFELKFEVPIK